MHNEGMSGISRTEKQLFCEKRTNRYLLYHFHTKYSIAVELIVYVKNIFDIHVIFHAVSIISLPLKSKFVDFGNRVLQTPQYGYVTHIEQL